MVTIGGCFLLFAASIGLVPAQGRGAENDKKGRIVRIVVAGDPQRALEVPREGLATSSKTGTGFRLIPGLANPEMVSFESTRAKGTYLRHHLWKMEIAERPKDVLLPKDFDWEATFGRGRDSGCPEPPAQIPAGGITAPGSYLE